MSRKFQYLKKVRFENVHYILKKAMFTKKVAQWVVQTIFGAWPGLLTQSQYEASMTSESNSTTKRLTFVWYY